MYPTTVLTVLHWGIMYPTTVLLSFVLGYNLPHDSLQLDDPETREARHEVDKFAPIRDLFSSFIKNIRKFINLIKN